MYSMRPRPKRTRHYMGYGLGLLIVGLTVAALVVSVPAKHTAHQPQLATKTVQAEPAAPTAANSKVLFTGDIYWGRSMNKWSQASPLKEAYPFSGLNGFHRDQYDAWVGNLECPTVPGVTPTKEEEQVLLKFNCSPSYLPELAKWFTAVSMANNHSSNQGAAGFATTRAQLDANHIQYFGHYDPDQLDQVCNVISLPVHVTLASRTTQKGALPVALCGYHGVAKIPSATSVAVMKKYSKYMPVIAYPHMGTEYQDHSDGVREELYHSMIDNGADAVLGNHPHWIQNSEAYKGKLIVYSMGNFIFDQQFDGEVTRSAAITLSLQTEHASPSQLAAWLKIGPTCTAFADTCLQEIEKQHLQRLPMALQFGMQAVDISNKLTKPASPERAQAVANRLQWNQTAAKLKPAGLPFTAQ